MSTYSNVLKLGSGLGIDPVGSIIASAKSVFRMEADVQNEIKLQLIKENFAFHYENNALYKKVCMEKQVSPEDIQSTCDLVKIPTIAIAKFKDVNAHLLLTKPITELQHELRSTGTSGIPSISRRDEQTLTRSVHSIYAMFREMFGFFGGGAVFLAPSAEDMPEMGLVKLVNMFSGLLDSSKFFVHDSSFDPQTVLDQLEKWKHVHTRHIIGPPFLVERLVQYAAGQQTPVKLDRQSKIITLGGWKSYTGREIDRLAFNKETAMVFGIQEDQVRDMFGLVETNFMAIDCEKHAKHVPPWVHFSVRDMDHPEREAAPGEPGRLAVYDPSSLAYPGFIMTEDLVYVSKCGCGRHGQTVHYMYRIKGAEIGCCAINLEKYMSDKEARITQCPIG